MIFLTFFELLQTFSRTLTFGARNSTTSTEAPTLHQFKSATESHDNNDTQQHLFSVSFA